MTHAEQHEVLERRVSMLEIQLSIARWGVGLAIAAAIAAAIGALFS